MLHVIWWLVVIQASGFFSTQIYKTQLDELMVGELFRSLMVFSPTQKNAWRKRKQIGIFPFEVMKILWLSKVWRPFFFGGNWTISKGINPASLLLVILLDDFWRICRKPNVGNVVGLDCWNCCFLQHPVHGASFASCNQPQEISEISWIAYFSHGFIRQCEGIKSKYQAISVAIIQ